MGSSDGIMTTLFEVPYLSGEPKPSDDIDELRWFKFDEILHDIDILIDSHKKLFRLYEDSIG